MEELDLFLNIGSWDMSILVKGLRLISEVGNGELRISNLSLEGRAVDASAGWSRLLDDPRNDGILGSSSGIFLFLSVSIID